MLAWERQRGKEEEEEEETEGFLSWLYEANFNPDKQTRLGMCISCDVSRSYLDPRTFSFSTVLLVTGRNWNEPSKMFVVPVIIRFLCSNKSRGRTERAEREASDFRERIFLNRFPPVEDQTKDILLGEYNLK